MNSSWHDFLAHAGARIENGVVADFGDAGAELRAAASQSVLADLSQLGVLEFSGADAEAFLQAQLSCDVKALPQSKAGLGAYCTAKGRMLADFFLVRRGERFLMILPREVAAPIQKRLRMFVLRSKVEIGERSDDWVLIGVAGPDAAATVASLPAEASPLEVPQERFMILLEPGQAPDTWKSLAARLKPVGSPCWEWLDIRSGIPLIGPSMQDQLVPQMANLELVGGVSFKKGCYPGQEIVARAQYLGKVKRRMFLASVDAAETPRAGDPLYSDDLGGQASGVVVNAQPSPDGGYDLLAVAQVGSKESSTVRLKSPEGPALRFGALPYPVQ